VFGYMDRLLYVDLDRASFRTVELDRDDVADYVTAPLGPDNVLIFMTGPYAGTRALSSSRHVVVARSPLTGLFGEANSGGSWAEALKKSGFDGLVVTGRSAEPVYLWIRDGDVEVRAASRLWGMDTFATDAAIKSETDHEAVVACIGPAGEKCIPLSVILNDGVHARTASRCGLGAVMGSKNLKAIAVVGSLDVTVHDPEGLRRSIRGVSKDLIGMTKGLREYGTAGAVATSESIGGLPVQNWRHQGRWKEGAEKITGSTILGAWRAGDYFCKRCIIGCGKRVRLPEGSDGGRELALPEYESLGLLGSNCLVDDPATLIRANDLCNRYGLDTMSTGGVIAFAMEAFEKGLISAADADGIDLRWGSGDGLIEAIHAIAARSGIGEVLCRGTRAAAEEIGGGAEEFAVHVKGLEFPAHDPRAYNAGGLNLATSSIGASHQAGFTHAFERNLSAPEIGIPSPSDPFTVEGKGALTAKTQNYMGMFDSLVTCKFLLFGGLGIPTLTEWYRHITGRPMDVEQFMLTGERIFTLKRLYNLECGAGRDDDILPRRILTLPKTGEGHTPNLPPLERMRDEYYRFRGWTEAGAPTRQKLDELGIVPRERVHA
jgi:aldehyde:ferredoxin oxidoreductase